MDEQGPERVCRAPSPRQKGVKSDAEVRLYNDYLITLGALSALIGVVESVAKERGIDILFDATRRARESISE